jgi:hypothetical protein
MMHVSFLQQRVGQFPTETKHLDRTDRPAKTVAWLKRKSENFKEECDLKANVTFTHQPLLIHHVATGNPATLTRFSPSDSSVMWSSILDWAFHWVLLWVAFELGKKWNEKDVAASIAALTEKQSWRRSQEVLETPMRV